MDYARFVAEGLPIGSGEAEGAIRHWIRRRLDVPVYWFSVNRTGRVTDGVGMAWGDGPVKVKRPAAVAFGEP